MLMNIKSFKSIFIRNLLFIVFLVGNSQGCRQEKSTSFRLETKQIKVTKFPIVMHALRDGGTTMIEVYYPDLVRTNRFYVSFSNDEKKHRQLFAGEEWILESPKPFTFDEGMKVFLEIRNLVELYFGKQEFDRIVLDQERLNNLRRTPKFGPWAKL